MARPEDGGAFRARAPRNYVRVASSAERKARNEAIFRNANETLERRAHELLGADDADPVPFLCECPTVECTEVALLTLAEYEKIRSSALRGLAVPGHEDTSIERVVAKNDRFVTTEKFGRAGEDFAAAHPRR